MSDFEETERKWKETRAQKRAQKKARQRENSQDDNLKRQKLDVDEETPKLPDDESNQQRKEVEEKKAENSLSGQQVAKLEDQVIARVAEADKPKELLTKLETGQGPLSIRQIGQRANMFGSNTAGLCLATGIDTFGH